MSAVIATTSKPRISYSKWKRMKECWRKFYEHHLRKEDGSMVLTPQATDRAFVGSAVQHIMEMVINKRLYRTYTQEAIFAAIDEDLKLLKDHINDVDNLKEPIDGQQRVAIRGAVILEDIQLCAVGTSKGYNIWVAKNSIIKKIREMYKPCLEHMMNEWDLDKTTSEVRLNTESAHFVHKGEVDFIIEHPEFLDIYDGKKSKSSFLDEDQLYHYKLMAEILYNKPVRNIGWYIWDENKILMIEEHDNSSQLLLERMLEKHKEKDDAGWVDPYDFPIQPDYGSCMFCDINDNCLGTNSCKDDIDEI